MNLVTRKINAAIDFYRIIGFDTAEDAIWCMNGGTLQTLQGTIS